MNRFSKQLAVIVVIAVSFTLPYASISASTPQGNISAVSSSNFAIELDGALAGFASFVEGGHATAAVINEPAGFGGIIKKHIGAIHYNEITISCGAGMSEDFYKWMKLWVEGTIIRKNGAIVELDERGMVLRKADFFNAIISEVAFPLLDASSKDAAQITVKFSPESTRSKSGSGRYNFPAGTGKATWPAANFRLRIRGGLIPATQIGAITVRRPFLQNVAGGVTDSQLLQLPLVVSDLAITLEESHAQFFHDWFEDFVIRGNSGDDQELRGSLEYLDQRGAVLLTLTFDHMGIFDLRPDRTESIGNDLPKVKSQVYIEILSFNIGAALPS